MRYLLPILTLSLGVTLGRMTAPSPVRAQAVQPSVAISIGGTTLRIGMTQEEVFSQFGPAYRLMDMGMPGVFSVSRKPVVTGGYFEVLGSVSFANGRLKYASKSWVAEQHSIESFWNGLFNSMSNAIGSTSAAATITIDSIIDPGYKHEALNIQLKDRKIVATRHQSFQDPKMTAYMVDEHFH